MSNQSSTLAVVEPAALHAVDWDALSKAVIDNDLTKLTPEEKVRHYAAVCQSLGLNPATQPFGYLNLKGKLTLYALKGATDQLRRLYGVSISRLEIEEAENAISVIAYAHTADGREDSDIGVVGPDDMKNLGRANAKMKAVTKAKRRVTLSICGLGMLDETEVETIPDAVVEESDGRDIDTQTGEVVRESIEHGTEAISDAPAPGETIDAVCRALAIARNKQESWTKVAAGLAQTLGMQIRIQGNRVVVSDDDRANLIKTAKTQLRQIRDLDTEEALQMQEVVAE